MIVRHRPGLRTSRLIQRTWRPACSLQLGCMSMRSSFGRPHNLRIGSHLRQHIPSKNPRGSATPRYSSDSNSRCGMDERVEQITLCAPQL